jgi:hypothetical protein
MEMTAHLETKKPPHTGGPHHHLNNFETNQKPRNNPTTSIAILHGFKLPDPIPNACPARREVCIKELPNEENRSPYNR